jgi:TatD DNase family protein
LSAVVLCSFYYPGRLMNLIDTHCHLYLEDFAADLDQVVERAAQQGVCEFYLPAIDHHSQAAMMALESRFPGRCKPMTGLHPCSVNSDYASELEGVGESLSRRAFAAIGEIGLDYHWDRSFDQEQMIAFQRQIEWAIQFNLPIVIHSRDSLHETIRVVKENQRGSLKGIFHCFSGDRESAARILDLGFYLGIGGVLTYKNSGLGEALQDVPLAWIVLETDAPYLTPVPFRGKRNESSYLVYIAEKLSKLKGIPVEEVARITTENVRKIFAY